MTNNRTMKEIIEGTQDINTRIELKCAYRIALNETESIYIKEQLKKFKENLNQI